MTEHALPESLSHRYSTVLATAPPCSVSITTQIHVTVSLRSRSPYHEITFPASIRVAPFRFTHRATST